MAAVQVAQLAATAAYAGFQWTVRLVVYPQLDGVAAGDFAAYERAHQRRISPLVGALFSALALSTGCLLLDRPSHPLTWVSLALFVALLVVTGLLAVPLHRRLEAGWDAYAHRSLLMVDGVRALLATADLACALVLNVT